MTMKHVSLYNEQGEERKEHVDQDIPAAACAAGEAMIVLWGEGGKKDGGGKSILSPPPPPMVLDHQPSKDGAKQQQKQEQEQAQHDGDMLSPLSLLPSGENGDTYHLASSGAGGPKPRMLRFFIMFSITWSAAITSCLGPYFPLVRKGGKGREGGEGGEIGKEGR